MRCDNASRIFAQHLHCQQRSKEERLVAYLGQEDEREGCQEARPAEDGLRCPLLQWPQAHVRWWSLSPGNASACKYATVLAPAWAVDAQKTAWMLKPCHWQHE